MTATPAGCLKQFSLPTVRSDVLNAAIQKARDDIMAQEDAEIFKALDAIAATCNGEGHPGRGKPMSECEHPDCVVQHVHDC
jgi:hypothetical protein